jgi:hypothetical protein
VNTVKFPPVLLFLEEKKVTLEGEAGSVDTFRIRKYLTKVFLVFGILSRKMLEHFFLSRSPQLVGLCITCASAKLCFCKIFNNTISYSDYKAPKDWMTLNNELESKCGRKRA